MTKQKSEGSLERCDQMPYADSDFFLALIKESDWLSKKAEKILREYKNNIWTSQWTLVEILMISEEYNLDPEIIVNSINQIAKIEGGAERILAAAHLMKESSMTVFDALHAVSCRRDKIRSSDSIFDDIGLERIRLEE